MTLIFAGLYAGVYFVHIYWFSVNVILYSAIGDALIAAILAGFLALLLRRRLPLTGFERGLMFIIWCVTGYAAAISGPTVLDRLFSFYILEKLQQRGGGIREDAIPLVSLEEYMAELRLIDVRLTEQLQSGTIEIVNGCVRLTEKGQRIASFSRFVRKNLLAKHRLLAGVYTDALVDPFKNSKHGPQGYECR
ncbi:hypothetical protein [Bradyrhizobium sp. USDA 336]|uniref:hypothetical protein n=1 Tax=Bradyrhizobium sp. USDA 336 TaxID=3156311 RepID=UPI00384E5A3D